METNETVNEPITENTPLPEDVVFTNGFASEVKGENIYFSKGGAAAINAQQSMEMDKGGAVAIAVGRDLDLTFGGGQFVAVGRDLTIENGGAQILTVGNHAEINTGGAMVLTAGEVHANHSTLGLVLARKVELGEGSKVIVNTPQAAVLGLAFGATFAVIGWLLRRR